MNDTAGPAGPAFFMPRIPAAQETIPNTSVGRGPAPAGHLPGPARQDRTDSPVDELDRLLYMIYQHA